MGSKSTIAWTDASWNPLRGTKGKWFCTKVSPGCKNCYAESMNIRFSGSKIPYVHGKDRIRLDEKTLQDPLCWRKPRRIFTCSMSDLFHENVLFSWVDEVFKVMARAERHTFQVLTKRPERMAEWARRWDDRVTVAKIERFPNIWMGTSVENQENLEKRIPFLHQVPAVTRFLSIEPLLGPLKLGRLPKPGWVIVGGESGPGARRMDPAWVREILAQCHLINIPVFVKQLGSVWAKENGAKNRKGEDPKEWPADLRVREWPSIPERIH